MTIYYLNEVLQKICIPLARFYYLKNIHVHRFSFIKKFTDVLFKSADKHFNIQPVYQYFILPFNKRIC